MFSCDFFPLATELLPFTNTSFSVCKKSCFSLDSEVAEELLELLEVGDLKTKFDLYFLMAVLILYQICVMLHKSLNVYRDRWYFGVLCQ